jgi:hypothetical protein
MTKVINIDALREEAPFVLVIGGVKHEMKIASVDDFIENMGLIEGLGTNPSFKDELEVSIKVIARAFPTLTEKEIRSWQVATIDKLFRISRGEDVLGEAEAPAEGNAHPAS